MSAGRGETPTIDLVCEECGLPFARRRSVHERSLRTGNAHVYCSLPCSLRVGRRRNGIEEWGDAEKDYLRDHYRTETHAAMAGALGRTKAAVGVMLSILGLVKVPSWDDTDDAFLRANHGRMTQPQLAAALGRSVDSVAARKGALGLRRRRLKVDATASVLARKLYDRGCSDSEIADHLGVGQPTVARWRSNWGLPAHGWNDRARARFSAARKRTGRARHFGRLRSLAVRQRAVEMGWPQARSPREARILEALAPGPLGIEGLGIALGTRKRAADGLFRLPVLHALVRRRLVTVARTSGETRRLYTLAPGVKRRAPGESPIDPEEIDLTKFDRLVCKLALRHGAPRANLRDSDQYADGWRGLVEARARFRPELGYKFITYAYHYIEGYIQMGNRYRRAHGEGGRPVAVVPFSQVGDDEDGDASTLAVAREVEPEVDVADQCATLLGCLDERSRRLVERVVLRGLTETEAAAMEVPPITKQRVNQIVAESLARMRERAG